MLQKMLKGVLCGLWVFCFVPCALAYEGDEKEFAMQWAAQDIAANIDFWMQMRNEVDAGTATTWRELLGRAIVSQPVAVFEVMQRAQVPVADFCPPLFIETDGYVVDQWGKAAMQTLEAFVFVEPAKEALRKACLEKIRVSLQHSPQ